MRSSGKDSYGYQQQVHSGFATTLGIRRRSFIGRLAGLGFAIVIVPSGNGQQRSRVRRIGLALGDDPDGGGAAFRQTLRALGYVEGQNLFIEAREGASADLAADLARMDLELVVAQALPFALAARAANPSMPLVIVTTPGIVSWGFRRS